MIFILIPFGLVALALVVGGLYVEGTGERDWAGKLQQQSRQRAASARTPAPGLGPRPIGFSDFIGHA